MATTGTATATKKSTSKAKATKVDTPSTDSLDTKTVSERRDQILIAADGKIALKGSVIEKDKLVPSLKALGLENVDTKLEIKADKKVTLEQWVFMLEALKKAGIPASDVPWLIKDQSKNSN